MGRQSEAQNLLFGCHIRDCSMIAALIRQANTRIRVAVLEALQGISAKLVVKLKARSALQCKLNLCRARHQRLCASLTHWEPNQHRTARAYQKEAVSAASKN